MILRALALLTFSFSLRAAELEVRFQAIERLLADQVFTQEGRHYVRGDKKSRCQYAYLESPRVGAQDGRLRVTARFSGRSALDMLGRCVGLGDSFDFILTTTPVVRNGAIVFKDVNISTPRDSYYIRRVRQALTGSFANDFKMEVRDPAHRLLEQAAPPEPGKPVYQRELSSFDLREIRVQPDSIVLVIDFRLVLK